MYIKQKRGNFKLKKCVHIESTSKCYRVNQQMQVGCKVRLNV